MFLKSAEVLDILKQELSGNFSYWWMKNKIFSASKNRQKYRRHRENVEKLKNLFWRKEKEIANWLLWRVEGAMSTSWISEYVQSVTVHNEVSSCRRNYSKALYESKHIISPILPTRDKRKLIKANNVPHSIIILVKYEEKKSCQILWGFWRT